MSALACLLIAASISPAHRASDAALIRLAKDAVFAEISGTSPPRPRTKSPVQPVFVTVEVGGRVLGCRGSLEPRSQTLEDEVVLAARAAARHDPRYLPLREEHTRRLLVTVTLVDRLEPVSSVRGLRQEDGLVLKAGGRSGVVLPWEGRLPETRLEWAYRKAVVPPGSSVALHRLVARRIRG